MTRHSYFGYRRTSSCGWGCKANGGGLQPALAFQTDGEMLKALGRVRTIIFHPVGTCKMCRADDGSAVVDPTLKKHGIEGLRVIDMSVMPGITSGNTNSPTVMIAERGAAMISGRNG